MVKLVLRNTVVLVLSFLFAVFLLAMIEWVGSILHPFPEDFAGTMEEVMEQVRNYPPLVLALLGGVGWGLTILVATWLATRFNTNRQASYGIGLGLVLLGGALFNMSMLPYPIWYWILELVVLPLGIFAGVRLGAKQAAME